MTYKFIPRAVDRNHYQGAKSRVNRHSSQHYKESYSPSIIDMEFDGRAWKPSDLEQALKKRGISASPSEIALAQELFNKGIRSREQVMAWNSHRKKAAFTLIELMVVIAIIGLLASLSFPVLNWVKRRARVATCMNNLKQIGAGFHLYANNNDGWLPVSFSSNNGYGTLTTAGKLIDGNYTAVNSWICPSSNFNTSLITNGGNKVHYWQRGSDDGAPKREDQATSTSNTSIVKDIYFGPPLGKNHSDCGVVLYLDGHAENHNRTVTESYTDWSTSDGQ